MEVNQISRIQVRKICSTVGMGLFLMTVINFISQIFVMWILDKLALSSDHFVNAIISNSIGLYIIGLGTFRLVTIKLPIDEVFPDSEYSLLEKVKLFLLSMGALYALSMLTNGIILIFKLKDKNVVNGIITGLGFKNLWVIVLATCVLAPIFEELLFRKWILGMLRPIGSQKAVIMSALLFGIFHMNIDQGIYAFGLGIILGCVALRTGGIKLTIVLHSLINFTGGVVSVILSGEFKELKIPYGSATLFFIIISFLFFGLIIFFRDREDLLYSPEFEENYHEEASFFETSINVGMILFYGLCATTILIDIISRF